MPSGGLYNSTTQIGMYGRNLTPNLYHMNPVVISNQDNGKGKLKEAEFEAAFAEATASFSRAGTADAAGVGDVLENIEDALKNITLEDDTKVGDDHVNFER